MYRKRLEKNCKLEKGGNFSNYRGFLFSNFYISLFALLRISVLLFQLGKIMEIKENDQNTLRCSLRVPL